MHRLGSSERPDLRLAVVIGAGGMGMAAGRRLAQRHRVLIADIDQGRAEAAAQAVRNEGGDATAFACDVTAPAAVQALAERVADLGGLGVLAHVAGLSPSMGDFGAIVRVNLTGVALVAESLLPHAATGSAAILISSLGGHHLRLPDAVERLLRAPTDPALVEKLAAELGDQATPPTAYAVSKHGLMAYCRGQAAAWGARGARIVSLSPGMIATPMGALEFENSPRKRQLYERTPLQREGTMLEIADAIEFLASDKASFITGTDLLVDGGLAGTLAEDRWTRGDSYV